MKKAFWVAISSVLAVAILVTGSTFALFSATTGSQDTTFTAGRLCLMSDRNEGDTVPGPMFYVTAAQGQTPSGQPGLYPTGLWAPGDQHNRTLTVYNNCPVGTSMDSWLVSIEAALHPGGYVPMADKLQVEVTTPQLGVHKVIASGPLSQFLAGPVPISYPDGSKIPLYQGANRHLIFKVTFDLSADNSYQDKTLVVDFKVNGVQMKNNP